MELVRETISILSYFVLPTLIVGFPLYGLIKGVRVYEEFVEGAKEGFEVAPSELDVPDEGVVELGIVADDAGSLHHDPAPESRGHVVQDDHVHRVPPQGRDQLAGEVDAELAPLDPPRPGRTVEEDAHVHVAPGMCPAPGHTTEEVDRGDPGEPDAAKGLPYSGTHLGGGGGSVPQPGPKSHPEFQPRSLEKPIEGVHRRARLTELDPCDHRLRRARPSGQGPLGKIGALTDGPNQSSGVEGAHTTDDS